MSLHNSSGCRRRRGRGRRGAGVGARRCLPELQQFDDTSRLSRRAPPNLLLSARILTDDKGE